MSVNEMTFEDLAAVVAEIQGQATNGEAVAPVDTASFVSVGQNLLKCGYDPLNTAISQVLGRTIFSNRAKHVSFHRFQSRSALQIRRASERSAAVCTA